VRPKRQIAPICCRPLPAQLFRLPAAFIKEDLDRWARVIAEGKIKVK
jgi:hypothetical protein